MAVNYEKPARAASMPANIDILPGRALTTLHKDDLEQTLPPTPVRELLAASGASACVLSADSAFVAVIVQAAGEQYPLSVVATWPELKAAVDSAQCGIAILDAALLGERTVGCVQALAPFAHRLVTLVAADRAAATELVGLLADRHIHRLLMKPSAVGATRLLIESAVARRLQLREAAANDAPAAAERRPAAARSRFSALALAAGVAVLLAIAGSVAWLQWRDRSAASDGAAAASDPTAVAAPNENAAAATAQEPADPAAQLRQRIETLLTEAEAARAEGRLTDPLGAGALEHYLAVLELAPEQEDARRGVVFVVESLFTRAEQALLSASLDEAAGTLDRIRRVEPTSTRLAFLDAQLMRALAATAPAPDAPAAAERGAAASELDSMLTLAAARLRRGQLLSPAGDNARDYLEQARLLDPDSAPAAALRAELATALVTAARVVAPSDVAAASAVADEARRQGAQASELAVLERELTMARASLEQRQGAASLAAARELMRQGALFAPPANNALAVLLGIQAQAPETEGLAATWAEFRNAIRTVVEAAAANGEPQTLAAALAALREAPEGAALAAQLAGEVEAQRQQERYLAEAVPASELRLLSAPAAAYPEEARANNIEGWVDVEFVIDRAGQPRDGKVIDARPSGTFNAAALAALATYRYAPFERDGRIYERRARLRIRFVLQ